MPTRKPFRVPAPAITNSARPNTSDAAQTKTLRRPVRAHPRLPDVPVRPGPRVLAVLGLVGGTLICVSGSAVLLGVTEAGSAWQVAASMPELFWELGLGVYLIVKGFKPSPVSTGMLD
jgi:hypothetical protein